MSLQQLPSPAQDVTRPASSAYEAAGQFRAIVDQNIAGVYILSVRGEILYVNERFAQLCGYSVADVSGRSFEDFVDPVDQPKARDSFANTLRGSARQIEVTLRHRDGSRIHLLAQGSLATYEGEPAVVGVALDITERRRLEVAERRAVRALTRVNRSLRLLIAANQCVVRANDEAALIADVVRLVVDIGGFAMGWVGFAEPDLRRSVRLIASAGNRAGAVLPLDVSWSDRPSGDGPIGLAIRTGKPQVDQDTAHNSTLGPGREVLLQQGLRSSIALPLRSDHRVFGVLTLYSSEIDAFDAGEAHLLQELANDLAYGIVSRRTAVDQVAAADRLRVAMENTVEVIAATLEARDPYTAGHQRRVAHLAAAIARQMGCDEATVRGVHFGALVHDVGKIQIPSELLSKPTRLTPIESRLLETHSEAGFEILKGIEFPWPVALIVLQHHERLDGSGYPNHLTGDQILKEARILAVADVVEAMASHRPYRPSRGVEVALAEIAEQRGRLYDAAAVDACLVLFREGYSLTDAA